MVDSERMILCEEEVFYKESDPEKQASAEIGTTVKMDAHTLWVKNHSKNLKKDGHKLRFLTVVKFKKL